ncbi:helix-turn-helix transcriptional regulator [Shinella pollutisoli]|uniref:LuxR C-terminal-related transcriptional regulator n=1 Tax=Shinella pollutisoli TaxID=2250594 RepID=A0ABV7DJM9_9HYPH|nr:LuxR family transcriptional regulator [Shinella pollutisoli]
MRDPDKMLMQQGWSPDVLTTANIEAVQTEYEVLHLMRRCAAHFNFSHFLVSRHPGSGQHRFSERLLVSNWPADLVRKYDSAEIFHLSRLALEAGATKLPVHGGTALLAPADGGGEEVRAAIALADGYGLDRFTAFLLHSTAADPYLMVFAGTRPPLERPELADLYYTSVQLFECLEKTFSTGTASREKLSSREIECLRWAAAGKSSDEIGIILGISAYTVSSYFKSATRKLQAVNRMQAIACALRLKLI